ncbi:type I-F CRISPR-associated protein Csy2 [Zoogloea dura]|jgi:CRISPR-associated protein Csy2|uniref:Type I-F CRISPR-associated protein Csy2 n=1 Tax=Zoogloea dura TaxID=2728840 RepID=A0A848GA74_9RHOO|nr:type I-F CRISPR-associated protein Csy2 [Zoogloea dura]NML27795.1 type I-F CRISPR-associated protein Csy2 [Zoogloea dura]
MSTTLPESQGLLMLPHLRIQNANAISSPLTHGLPSMTAFLGLMWALERKLCANGTGMAFNSVGVICHDFDEQVTEGGYTKAFRLTRNPVDRDGSTAAIVEEGRIHLDITLVFGVSSETVLEKAEARQTLADTVAETLAGMRVAGGSIVPTRGADAKQGAELIRLAEDSTEAGKQFRRLRRRWLPGFALVCRDDLLAQRLASLRAIEPTATALDALLDLSRINWRPEPAAASDSERKGVEWKPEPRAGWIVPIPVGYGALSGIHPAGSVKNARDSHTDFRFVESLYSIGQWISPHRLGGVRELLWYGHSDVESGLYRCRNDFAAAPHA